MSLRFVDLSTAFLSATRAPGAFLERQSQRLPARQARRAATAAVVAASPARRAEPIQSLHTLRRELTCTRTNTATECRLQIEGALDVHSAPELRSVFDSVLSAQPLRVILELERLTMIDSSGVGAIVSLFKRVKAAGGTVVVKGVQSQPLAVFKLLKLDRVFGL